MAKEECRTAGYKLLGDYIFSEIIPEMITGGRWDMVSTSAKAVRSALQLSHKEEFISGEQLQALDVYLTILEHSSERKNEKDSREAFDTFFKEYSTVIIDAIGECECRGK